MGPGAGPGRASSHLDAPTTIANPQLDSSDVFAFTSPDRPDTVTLIATYVPLQFPVPLPHYKFASDAAYDINVDPQGTGTPAVTYRWTFRDDSAGAFGQRYRLQELRRGQPPKTLVADAAVGRAANGPFTPDYDKIRNAAITELPGGGRAFAGQAKDPFFADTRILSELGTGNPFFFLANFNAPFNIHSIAIQVPKKDLALRGDPGRNPVIGIWTSASRRSLSLSDGTDRYRQISRLGNGLFSSAVATFSTALDRFTPGSLADRFNAAGPDQDRRIPELMGAVRDPSVPRRVNLTSLGLVKAPTTPRTDLEEIYLTGMTSALGGPIKKELNSQLLNKDVVRADFVAAEELRLNMSTPVAARPQRFGLLANDEQGFPNGRRLGDDATIITLRILLGEPAGRGSPTLLTYSPVTGPARTPGGAFPYLALPNLR